MYEHKGFIALLRFAHARFDRLSERRKTENRNSETSLLFETWVSPVHTSVARRSERKKPAEPAYFLPAFIRGQAKTEIMRVALLSAIDSSNRGVPLASHVFPWMNRDRLQLWEFRCRLLARVRNDIHKSGHYDKMR